MCGFIGVVDLEQKNPVSNILSSCEMIKHRGPDGYGYAVIDLEEKSIAATTSEEGSANSFFSSKK